MSKIDEIDKQKFYMPHEVQKILWYRHSNQWKAFIENYCFNVEYISGKVPIVLWKFVVDALILKSRILRQWVKTYSKARKLSILFLNNDNNDWTINTRESIMKWLDHEEGTKSSEQISEEEDDYGIKDSL